MDPDREIRADRSAPLHVSPGASLAGPLDLDDRLRALHATIDREPPPDPLQVVERVDAIANELRRAGRVRELDAAISAVESRRPAIFEYGFCYFQGLRVENQLLAPEGDLRDALFPMAPFCAMPESSLLDVVDALLYHGRRAELLALLERGLPRVEEVVDVEMELEGRSLRHLAVQLLLDGWLERSPPLYRCEAGLVAAVARFELTPEAELQLAIDERGGWRRSAHRRADFAIGRPLPAIVSRLDALLHHFASTLVIDRAWPGPRAQLARLVLRSQLLDRLSDLFGVGPLSHCDECVRLAAPSRRPRRGGPPAFLPDLAGLFERWEELVALPGSPYRPAALLEALPAWLDYLGASGLAGRAELALLRRQLVADVPRCTASLAEEFFDPLVVDNLESLCISLAAERRSRPDAGPDADAG